MGHSAIMGKFPFAFPLWTNVPLPSTSPKNKCFGEAPLPCGAGRRFLLPTVAENIVWNGRFCRDKGQKVFYPRYNLSAKKSPPTLYKEYFGRA